MTSVKPVKVFRPTLAQYRNMAELLEKIENDKDVVSAGMAKIKPPIHCQLKPIDNEMVLNNCVVQSVKKLKPNSDLFMLQFDDQKEMKYKDFKEMAGDNIDRSMDYDQTETLFWSQILPKQISSNNFPTYAIDNEMSRFPDSHEYWNLNKMTPADSILQVANIPGVTTPFTNFGMKYTSFAAHVEDSNMGSINIHHEGAGRQWYSVPSSQSDKLEEFLSTQIPRWIAEQCDRYYRHKSILIPPKAFEENNIEYAKTVQEPGEVIVTLYNSYHQGFNHGFTCSEAVNYATTAWRKSYIKTTLCSCESYGAERRQLHEKLGAILKKYVPIASPSDPRYDTIDHWAVFDDATSRSRCKLEGCKNFFSRIYCTKCNVHLCLNKERNCFYDYHHF